jgi:catechol 2,3-dioxygenase-like lactoylglutathione lyase family enzyme
MNPASGDVEHVMAGFAVADLGRALDWYERFVGRPADVVPNETEAMWQLSGSGWLYVVLDAERAGRGLLTLMVADLDAALAGCSARDIKAGRLETAPGRFRKVVVVDPDGNRIQLGEDLSGG